MFSLISVFLYKFSWSGLSYCFLEKNNECEIFFWKTFVWTRYIPRRKLSVNSNSLQHSRKRKHRIQFCQLLKNKTFLNTILEFCQYLESKNPVRPYNCEENFKYCIIVHFWSYIRVSALFVCGVANEKVLQEKLGLPYIKIIQCKLLYVFLSAVYDNPKVSFCKCACQSVIRMTHT